MRGGEPGAALGGVRQRREAVGRRRRKEGGCEKNSGRTEKRCRYMAALAAVLQTVEEATLSFFFLSIQRKSNEPLTVGPCRTGRTWHRVMILPL